MAKDEASEPVAADAPPPAVVPSELAQGAAPSDGLVAEPDKGEDKVNLGGDQAEKGRQIEKQRTDTRASTSVPPKPREQMTTEELRQVLKKQVEYYLSDTNLETDAFFHGKIQDAEKEGKGVRLNLGFSLFLRFVGGKLGLNLTVTTCLTSMLSLAGPEQSGGMLHRVDVVIPLASTTRSPRFPAGFIEPLLHFEQPAHQSAEGHKTRSFRECGEER